MKILTKVIISAVALLALSTAAFALVFITPHQASVKAVWQPTDGGNHIANFAINDCDFVKLPYQEAGYNTLKDYWEELVAKRAEASGVAEQAIEVYAEVITDEQNSS